MTTPPLISDLDHLADQFLVAMPSMGDSRFEKSVTYVCEHNDEGALGIVINRPLGVSLGEVLNHMSIETHDDELKIVEVYMGGPVETQRGFVLHTPGGDWDSGLALNGELQVTTSRDILEAIAVGEGPEHYLIALGYAGWSAGQLEAEMADNAWLNVDASADILFATPTENRWHSAANLIGVDLSRMSADTGHA